MCLWTGIVDAIAIYIVIAFARLGGATGVWVGATACALFTLVGWFLVAGRADVVVSDGSISRRLWGLTLKEVPWDSVKEIRVATAIPSRGRPKGIRIISVCTEHSSESRPCPSARIWFSERGDLTDVIAHLNRQIERRKIVVRTKDHGGWVTQPRIGLLNEQSLH